jgi:7-cyano-7-deazaguanine synthase in queuosine biosynthesis
MSANRPISVTRGDEAKRRSGRRFDGVILLSGGLDSTVMAHQAVSEGKSLRAIYLDFATYPTLQELNSARRTAHLLGMPFDVVDVSGVPRALVGYVPLSVLFADELDVTGETPYAFVSFAVPLAVASYYAQAVECAEIWAGAVGEQASGRKNLAAFFEAWPRTLSLLADPSAPELVVRTPFLGGPKSAVVTVGEQLGVEMDNSGSLGIDVVSVMRFRVRVVRVVGEG